MIVVSHGKFNLTKANPNTSLSPDKVQIPQTYKVPLLSWTEIRQKNNVGLTYQKQKILK